MQDHNNFAAILQGTPEFVVLDIHPITLA